MQEKKTGSRLKKFLVRKRGKLPDSCFPGDHPGNRGKRFFFQGWQVFLPSGSFYSERSQTVLRQYKSNRLAFLNSSLNWTLDLLTVDNYLIVWSHNIINQYLCPGPVQVQVQVWKTLDLDRTLDSLLQSNYKISMVYTYLWYHYHDNDTMSLYGYYNLYNIFQSLLM